MRFALPGLHRSDMAASGLIAVVIRFALVVVLATMVTACEGITPLMQAAKDGDAERTSALIANGANVDELSDYRWSALMFAAHYGHANVVDLLLQAGANPNVQSERVTNARSQTGIRRSNALQEAIDNGHIDIARVLLDSGARPDPTAFAMAGGANDLALLEKMLALGANPNTLSPDTNYVTALCVASYQGDLQAAQWLIEKGADVNLEALHCNAFYAAVAGDNLVIAKLLISNGARPNVQYWPTKETPLLRCVRLHTMSPAYDSEFKLLEFLLSLETDRSYRVKDWPYENRTPLEFVNSERDRAEERSHLPGFDFDWPGGTPQLIEKHDAVIELLRDNP